MMKLSLDSLDWNKLLDSKDDDGDPPALVVTKTRGDWTESDTGENNRSHIESMNDSELAESIEKKKIAYATMAPKLPDKGQKMKDWIKKLEMEKERRERNPRRIVKALSAISEELTREPSPFHNLKYVKLPHEYNESSISSAVRSYLLGGSSRGTIVTTLPRNTIPHTEAVSMTAQNAVLQEPLAVPTKELTDTQYIHQTKSVNTINMNVQEEHVVEDSVENADRVRDINPFVKETAKDRVISSVGNQDFGLWRGHKVNSEFVCLLDRIMSKYPETFKNFTKKNKNLCTMNLNMLCTSMNDFTKISMTEVDYEMLVEYRDVFAYLQNKGFNVRWVVRRLDYIEHLRYSKPLIPELYAIDCRIDDDKSKLQELQSCVDDAKIKLQNLQARVDAAETKLQNVQTLRVEKLTEIEKAFGTLGTKLAVGFVADDLLSDP